MADDQTGSIWTHYDGTVLTGPLAGTGTAMEIQPVVHTTWQDWLGQHPDTLVPIWETGYEDEYRVNNSPGGGRLRGLFEQTLLHQDDRLSEGELVVGANLGPESIVYVLADFTTAAAVNDTLADQPIVTFIDPETLYGLTFCASVDGQVLTFESSEAGWSTTDGTSWDDGGYATSGPMRGTQLDFVTSFVTEWYGWVAYHPDSTIYGSTE